MLYDTDPGTSSGMSEVFQGVLFADAEAGLEDLFRSLPTRPEVITVAGGRLALSPPGRDLDLDYGRGLASQVSKAFGSALLVAYDSRIGLRHSQLYRHGSAEATFGFNTELWHALREDGEPDTERKFSTHERVSGAEYETAEDALTQGLRAFGLVGLSGQELVQVACYRGGA